MCRNTFLSLIFSFIFVSAFFGIMVNEAVQEPSETPDAFALTATSIIQTATAQAQPSRTIDPFSLTATSIIATATAQAYGTDGSSAVKPSTTPEDFGATATALIQTATANAQTYPTLDPVSLTGTAQGQPNGTPDYGLTATSIIQTATARAYPTQGAGTDTFEMAATSIIQTATAMAQPSQTLDPFALTANAQPSQQFLPWIPTQTAAAQTQSAIATANPTPCEGFEWTFSYFAAEASYGIDVYEITERICYNTEYTLYAFEISIMDASGTLSDDDFYMLFESSVGSFSAFPEEYPLRKPEISELILVTNFNTMQSWEFTYTDAVAAWEEGLRGQEFAEALGVILR